jgi:hypothetical protein
VKYSWLTIGMLFFIGMLYFASATSYLMVDAVQQAFPAESLKHNSFNLYKNDSSWLFRNIFFLYFPNNLYTYVMNSIFATEIIETLPFLKQLITNEVGSVKRTRLVALRISVWFAAILISLGMKDVVHVLNLSGSLFTPIVSYFGPVDPSEQMIIFYSYCSAFHCPISRMRKVHDFFFIVISLTVAFWGIKNSID